MNRSVVNAQHRTLVTLATYNECENLPSLVEEILRVQPDVDILVIDDNSPDGTGLWCDEMAEKETRLHCLHREGKLGLGTAMIEAFEYTIRQDYTYMLNMDADRSHDPHHIPELLAAMEAGEEPTVAIGSRYVAGGGIEGWPITRHWMSRAVNWYSRVVLRLPVRDCSGAFRCYQVDLLRRLDFDQVQSRGYSFEEEILWLLGRKGAKFREIPIRFVNRTSGVSKISFTDSISGCWILLKLGVRGLLGR